MASITIKKIFMPNPNTSKATTELLNKIITYICANDKKCNSRNKLFRVLKKKSTHKFNSTYYHMSNPHFGKAPSIELLEELYAFISASSLFKNCKDKDFKNWVHELKVCIDNHSDNVSQKRKWTNIYADEDRLKSWLDQARQKEADTPSKKTNKKLRYSLLSTVDISKIPSAKQQGYGFNKNWFAQWHHNNGQSGFKNGPKPETKADAETENDTDAETESTSSESESERAAEIITTFTPRK